MAGPASTAVPGLESPVDRALGARMAGDADTALRWAAGVVKSEPGSPIGLWLLARLLGDQQKTETALAGLRAAASRATEASNLALAVAAACEITALGGDANALLDGMADAFHRGSPRMEKDDAAAPPSMPGRTGPEIVPAPPALAGPSLIARAEEILKEAVAAAQLDAGGGTVRDQVLFSSLNRKTLRALLAAFELVEVPTGDALIEQGAIGAEAYVVARGEVEARRTPQGGGDDV